MSKMLQMYSEKQADGSIKYVQETLRWALPEGFDPVPLQAVADSLGMKDWSPDNSGICRIADKPHGLQAKFDAMVLALAKVVDNPVMTGASPLCIQGKATCCGAPFSFGVQHLKKDRGIHEAGWYMLLGPDKNIVWDKHPDVELGETVGTIDFTEQEWKDKECIADLQEGNDNCYSADLVVQGDFKYVFLVGNGWKDECGFPYIPSTGRYPLLGGKTAKKMIELCAANRIPSFHEVWSGNQADLKEFNVLKTA